MSRPARDRRAVRHPAAAGRLRDDHRRSAAVVGGGIAGLAAATALAERGVQVTLVERERQLGGRVRSWPLAGGRTMSRGFHAFFRQYYNLRALLRRADRDLSRLRPVEDYPLLHANGRRDSFRGLPRTPPLNMIGFVLRSRAFGLSELRGIDLRAALELVTVDFPATFERASGESAAAYLRRLNFPEAARDLALEVFSRSFFADPEQFSAAEMIAMFHAYFLGSAEGLLFDVPDDDYDTALWHPLSRYLATLGVQVRTGETVDAIDLDGSEPVLVTSGGELATDAVVVADQSAARTLLCGAPTLDGAWAQRLGELRHAPPFAVVRWWFDRPAQPERAAFLGTAGFDLVDNVSVLDRFETGAAGWSARTGGSVVEAHAYALADAENPEDVRARMRAVLDRVYPEFRDVRSAAQEFLLAADCPLIDTAPWRSRPATATPDRRVVLAGDWVRCDHPVALMERAATTGFLAANALLASWGLAGHDVWTVPVRNRYSWRRSA